MKSRERTRKWLIATGVPLAISGLAFGITFGGIYALCAATAAFVAMRTIDLILSEDQ